MKTIKERNYIVSIWHTVNPCRDLESDEPETKSFDYEVSATNEVEAYKKAKELHYLAFPQKGIYDHSVTLDS